MHDNGGGGDLGASCLILAEAGHDASFGIGPRTMTIVEEELRSQAERVQAPTVVADVALASSPCMVASS